MAKTHVDESDDLKTAYREALSRYGQRPYVTAIDIGNKYVEGKRTAERSVRIHVTEKKDRSVLEADEVFPEHIRGIPVDVIQATYAPDHALISGVETEDRMSRFSTLQPGISVAHKDVSAGTLGMFVRDNKTKKPAILSNWHVLAGSGTARPGDDIVQPGPYDGGKHPRDVVAKLERMMLDRDGDAAIAILNPARKYATTALETNHAIKAIGSPKVGDVLTKSGRTTGVTKAVVDGAGTYFITYPVGRVGIEGFILVPMDKTNSSDIEISQGGDSGSVWFDERTGVAVGLHFAGETNPLPSEEHAVACYLTRVFERLDISVLTLPEVQERIEDTPTLATLASELGSAAASAAFERLDGREIRRFAIALGDSYPRLTDSESLNQILARSSAPEIGPLGAVAIGFAAGAAARIVGKSMESTEHAAAEAFPVVVAAFLAGAAAGARAVDGKL